MLVLFGTPTYRSGYRILKHDTLILCLVVAGALMGLTHLTSMPPELIVIAVMAIGIVLLVPKVFVFFWYVGNVTSIQGNLTTAFEQGLDIVRKSLKGRSDVSGIQLRMGNSYGELFAFVIFQQIDVFIKTDGDWTPYRLDRSSSRALSRAFFKALGPLKGLSATANKFAAEWDTTSLSHHEKMDFRHAIAIGERPRIPFSRSTH